MSGATAAYRVVIFLTKDPSSLTELAHQIEDDERLSSEERDTLLPLIPARADSEGGRRRKAWIAGG